MFIFVYKSKITSVGFQHLRFEVFKSYHIKEHHLNNAISIFCNTYPLDNRMFYTPFVRDTANIFNKLVK